VCVVITGEMKGYTGGILDYKILKTADIVPIW